MSFEVWHNIKRLFCELYFKGTASVPLCTYIQYFGVNESCVLVLRMWGLTSILNVSF